MWNLGPRRMARYAELRAERKVSTGSFLQLLPLHMPPNTKNGRCLHRSSTVRTSHTRATSSTTQVQRGACNSVWWRVCIFFRSSSCAPTAGWNACSSCHGDPNAARTNLILPGLASGRIYGGHHAQQQQGIPDLTSAVLTSFQSTSQSTHMCQLCTHAAVDTATNPRAPKLAATTEPEEIHAQGVRHDWYYYGAVHTFCYLYSTTDCCCPHQPSPHLQDWPSSTHRRLIHCCLFSSTTIVVQRLGWHVVA
jgi:hypothetical protein